MRKTDDKHINFKWRYIPAFAIIIILIIARQFIVDYQIDQNRYTSKIINIAGKQRMLSQMITKDIYILSHSEDSEEMDYYLNQLISSCEEFEMSNGSLINGDLGNGIYVENSDAIKNYFSEIESSFNVVIKTGENVIKLVSENQLNHDEIIEEMYSLLENEPIFLEGMEKIVDQYELEASEKIDLLTNIEMILFWLILVVVVFFVLFIFFPFEKIIKDSFERTNETRSGILKLLHIIQEPVFLIREEDTRVVLMSGEARNIIKNTGFDEKIILKDALDIISIDKDILFDLIIKEEKVNNLEVVISKNKNENLTFLLSASKVRYLGKPSVLITLFDITTQKDAEDMLRHMSVRDKLTGLYNRYFLDEIINEEMNRALRYNFQLSVFILDLDHFKNVNDTWGHPVGDIILKETAELATRNLRRSDFLIRIGGEEFLLLMPHTNLKEAMVVANKIRKEIEDIVHPIIGKYTASFGVAQWDKSESFKELYERADEALYKAKEKGRNRVVSSKKKQPYEYVGNPIQWKSEWECGNKVIDEQHKELLSISNEFVFLSLPQSDPVEPVQKIDDLIKHVAYHFECEEAILKESGYLGYIEHAKIHEKIKEDVESLKMSYNKGEVKITAFFTFMLEEVVIGHLLDEDVKFFKYVKKSRKE